MAIRSLCILLCAVVAEGLTLPTPYGSLQLDVWGGDSIRVRFAPPQSVIIQTPPVQALLPSPPTVHQLQSEAPLSVTSGNLRADVDSVSGLVTLTRVSDGVVLMQQTSVVWGAPAPGAANMSASLTSGWSGLEEGERIYGLGEHISEGVGMTSFASDWAGEDNGALTIPFVMSSRGFGVLCNHAGYGSVAINASAHVWALTATKQGDFWVTAAPPPASSDASPLAAMLGRYADVVGHTVPMPSELTGFVMSQNRYRNQSQLLSVAHGMVSRGLPLDVIVIDYLSWTQLGDDTLTPACWPDPAAMVSELRGLNVSLLVSFYPYFNVGSGHYDEFVHGGLTTHNIKGGEDNYNGCLGGQNVYDPFNPAARAAMFNAWTSGYGRYNITNAWLDCDEPGRNLATNGQWRGVAGMDSEVGAAWPREHSRTMAEGNARAGIPNSFTLVRSFYPGSNALNVVLWSGDVEATFESLAQQVRVAQQVALSGVAAWCSDTGGYKGGDANDPVFRELIVRWSQFSAFTAVFRFHGRRLGGPPDDACGPTHGDNSIWAYGDEATAAISLLLHLRASLRSYTAAANALTVATGLPVVRPLVLAFPSDPNCAMPWAERCYMYGDVFLVCPVTTYGARQWGVYLPKLTRGDTWRAYFSNATMGGGGVNVTVDTPLDAFPLFMREGAPKTEIIN